METSFFPILQTNVQQGEQRVSDAKGYIGHYGSECLSKATAVTQEVEISSEEEAFLGTVASKDNTSWSVNIRLQGRDKVQDGHWC